MGDNVTDCLAAERAEIDFIFINSNFIKDLDMRRSEKYAIYENLYDLWIGYEKMIIGIIPARGGSKESRKNLVKVKW